MQETTNTNKSGGSPESGSAASRQTLTPQSKADFEKVLENVTLKMETDANGETSASAGPVTAQGFSGGSAAELRRRQEAGKKEAFEHINAQVQKVDPQGSVSRAGQEFNPAGMVEGNRNINQVKAQKKAEIEKVVLENMEEDLTERQKILVRLAGDQAVEVMYKSAEKMAAWAEKGGVAEGTIILFTFILAIVKDLIDAPVEVLITAGLAIPLAGEANYIIVKIIMALLGFIISTFILFFWMIILSGGEFSLVHNLTKRLLKKMIAVFIFECFIDILPAYTVGNLLNLFDYIGSKRKAGQEVENTYQNIKLVQEQTNSTINSLN
jgi:hypothetical protein